MSKAKDEPKRPRGRPPLYDGGPELQILNCKVPLDIKIMFIDRAKSQGFKSASAKLRKMVIDDMKKATK